nr:MAG TPA: hypothetical protein [Caudoviricetes sp.]
MTKNYYFLHRVIKDANYHSIEIYSDLEQVLSYCRIYNNMNLDYIKYYVTAKAIKI